MNSMAEDILEWLLEKYGSAAKVIAAYDQGVLSLPGFDVKSWYYYNSRLLETLAKEETQAKELSNWVW